MIIQISQETDGWDGGELTSIHGNIMLLQTVQLFVSHIILVYY